MVEGTPVRYGPYKLAATVTQTAQGGKRVRLEFEADHLDPEWVDADKCYPRAEENAETESLF